MQRKMSYFSFKIIFITLCVLLITNLSARGKIPLDSLKHYAFTIEQNKEVLTISHKDLLIQYDPKTHSITFNRYTFPYSYPDFISEDNGKLWLSSEFLNVFRNPSRSKVDPTFFKTRYPAQVTVQNQTYTIRQRPESAISLLPSTTELIASSNLLSVLKGRTTYCNFPESVQSVQTVGSLNAPKIEKILMIQPDIIFANPGYKKSVLQHFEKLGVETVLLPTAPSLDDMVDYILQIGTIFDQQLLSRFYAFLLRDKMNRFKSAQHSIRPSAYYIVATGTGGEYTAGGDTFIHEVLKLSGYENVAANTKGWSYTLEKLLLQNPDYIFGSAKGIALMKKDPKYKSLRAIQNNKAFVVDADIFHRPSPRVVEIGIQLLKGFKEQ